jgi:hypothetical protein
MTKLPFPLFFALLSAAGFTPMARADFVFQTTPGAKATNNELVNAKATFSLSQDTMTVKLENLIVDQNNVGQSITGVTFKMNTTTSGASLTSSTGTQRDLQASNTGGYTFTDTPLNVPGKNNTGWGFPVSSGDQLSLDWFSRDKSITGNQVQYTLIGQPGGNNKYNNANTSLVNGAHNPPLAGPLYFFLKIPGVSATTLITDVTFFFGTAAGVKAPGVGGRVTPAPAGFVLAATGLASLGFFGLRQRRRMD